MCGISVIIKNNANILEKSIQDSLDLINHRGPDGQGIFIEGNIGFGHKRLSIQDLNPRSDQPMQYRDLTITYNGEIYNFLEIKDELISLGHNFETTSDTEVILAAYSEWGENCVEKFNGMWAFAIWDSEKKQLFLSRDRFGKKPLFYSFVNGKFIFASEMKAIYPFLPEVKASNDFHWMKNNTFLYEGTDKCLVDGIKRFPFGHNGIYKDGNLSVKRYWNTLDHLEIIPETYEAQVERFRELFFNA